MTMYAGQLDLLHVYLQRRFDHDQISCLLLHLPMTTQRKISSGNREGRGGGGHAPPYLPLGETLWHVPTIRHGESLYAVWLVFEG